VELTRGVSETGVSSAMTEYPDIFYAKLTIEFTALVQRKDNGVIVVQVS
jgi:hypothetical protein